MQDQHRHLFVSHQRGVALIVFLALAVLSAWLAIGGIRETGADEPASREEVTERFAPGTSTTALERARGVFLEELERGAFPGGSLAIGVGQRVELLEGYGRIGWREAAAQVSPETTMYDLASVTKAVATTVAVLILAEDGKLDLDQPVQRHLPEFEGEFKERITWRHLLTHTSGLPGGAVIRGDSPAERARRLLRTRTMGPDQMVTYTDLGFLVLWEAAERVAGEPLEIFLERRVWMPLGMHSTAFSPGQQCEACAPTLRLSTGIPFRGQPSDLLARRLGGVTGNAGLFSTASDMARFAAMMAGGGELDGTRILSSNGIAEMFRQQEGAGRRTLGWTAFCPEESFDSQTPCREPVAYGHSGWPGTSLWMSPGGGPWVVLLTNRSYDVRAESRMDWLRWEIFRSVAGGQAVETEHEPEPAISSPDAG